MYPRRSNYEKYARKSHTDAFWLVDEEYQLVDNFIKYVLYMTVTLTYSKRAVRKAPRN